MKEAVTDAQQRLGFPLRSELRSFRSLQDGDENRCSALRTLVAEVRAFPRREHLPKRRL